MNKIRVHVENENFIVIAHFIAQENKYNVIHNAVAAKITSFQQRHTPTPVFELLHL